MRATSLETFRRRLDFDSAQRSACSELSADLMSTSPAITVVGAGVIGLSAAILAQEAGYHVTILSAHFPCDGLSIAYTSCWAGAHLVSVATADQPELHAYDRETFEVLAGLLESDENIPVMMRQQTELRQHVSRLIRSRGCRNT